MKTDWPKKQIILSTTHTGVPKSWLPGNFTGWKKTSPKAQIVIFEGAVDWKAGLNIGKVCSVFPYLQLYIPVHMILLCVSFFFEMFNAVSFSRSLWLMQTHSLLLVLWRSKNGISSGIVSVSERRILPHKAWGEVSLLDSDTVFDLGFPAKGTMCPSQQFSEGHFVFFFFWGGGSLYFFL